MSDRIFLTKEEAKGYLKEGDTVHCIIGGQGWSLGYDLDRKAVEDFLDTAEELEVAGAGAFGMGHGLHADGKFLETNEEFNKKYKE